MFWTGLIIGILLGANVGLFLFGLFAANGRYEDPLPPETWPPRR